MKLGTRYSVMVNDKQFVYAGMDRQIAEEFCDKLNKAADAVRKEMEAKGLKEEERNRVRFWIKAWN